MEAGDRCFLAILGLIRKSPLVEVRSVSYNMLNGSLSFRRTVPYALAFLCMHTLWMAFLPSSAVTATYAFQILASSGAYAACAWYGWHESSRLRLNRILLAGGLLLWTTGVLLSAWGDLVRHVPPTVAYISDFVYFFYGVPVLLAISLPNEGPQSRVFSWIDSSQAVLAGCLVYIEIFSVTPFSGGTSSPIAVSLLLRTYNIENVVLAGAATLRLFSFARGSKERRFYEMVTIFLWTYAVFAALYNQLDVFYHAVSGTHDALIDVPFLVLVVMALGLPSSSDPGAEQEVEKARLALLIENGSPIFFTLALLALGAAIVKQHFAVGMTAIAAALLLYGLRAAVLQTRYMHSQWDLQEARDRLEELSLQDPLTGVANRRCFDRILEIEWNRATRMNQPLSLLMVDVDFFKNLNDRFGHRMGDECLIQVAQTLRGCLSRTADLLARYGGEEFAVVLPATDRAGAETVAAKMRLAVRALNIPNGTADCPFMTISVGVATYEDSQRGSHPDLVEASDRALYQAKANGRNRVEFAAMTAMAGVLPAD